MAQNSSARLIVLITPKLISLTVLYSTLPMVDTAARAAARAKMRTRNQTATTRQVSEAPVEAPPLTSHTSNAPPLPTPSPVPSSSEPVPTPITFNANNTTGNQPPPRPPFNPEPPKKPRRSKRTPRAPTEPKPRKTTKSKSKKGKKDQEEPEKESEYPARTYKIEMAPIDRESNYVTPGQIGKLRACMICSYVQTYKVCGTFLREIWKEFG